MLCGIDGPGLGLAIRLGALKTSGVTTASPLHHPKFDPPPARHMASRRPVSSSCPRSIRTPPGGHRAVIDGMPTSPAVSSLGAVGRRPMLAELRHSADSADCVRTK